MARTKIEIIIILFAILLTSATAQAEEKLLWDDCVREAKAKHPDLIAAWQQIKQNKAQKEITRSAYLPQIDSGFSETTTGGSAQGAAGQTTMYTYDITGQQLLFDGFQTSYNLSADERNIIASKFNYDVISSNIRLNLKTAFAELLNAQELVRVTEDILARRKQTMELVRLRYDGGLEHRGSVMKSEADVAEAVYNLQLAKRNIYQAQIALLKELGRSRYDKYDLFADSTFEVKDQERERPDFENIASTNPLLRELVAKKESAKFGYKSANAAFFPQIFASGSAGKSQNKWPPDSNQWSIGTSISFPIFEGGQRYATVSKTLAAWKQSEADERSGRDGVILTMANTWTNLQDAMDNVVVQKKFLDAAAERAKISTAEYSIGLLSYDNWTIIEDNFVNAKLAYLNAQTSALVAEAAWIQAKGGTLDYD